MSFFSIKLNQLMLNVSVKSLLVQGISQKRVKMKSQICVRRLNTYLEVHVKVFFLMPFIAGNHTTIPQLVAER